MANNDNLDTGSYVAADSDWTEDESFWRTNYASRPYASSDHGLRGVSLGATGTAMTPRASMAAGDGATWKSEVRSGWQKFEGRGERAWEQIRGAVRDAWDRVTGH